MTKFLHIADIHLGIRRYRSEERSQDFFLAWKDCIERYALAEQVSFVLIAGDFFDARKVEPRAMNQAMYGLIRLREAGIPVIVIEGNHDSREVGTTSSWLRSLSRWGYIKLIEPIYEGDGVVNLVPWDDEDCSGSYIDIGDVRIFGSVWYGSTVSQSLTCLVDLMRDCHAPERFNVMLLHTDVEGHVTHPSPPLPKAKLLELKSYIDYLALGHTHKNFVIDDWAYNPGSLEACSVDEYAHERGAYLVEVNGKTHTAKLMKDYHQRPVVRVGFDVNGQATPEELHEKLFAQLRRELTPHDADAGNRLAPVIELTLRGQLGFKNALLELNRIRDEVKKEFRSLLVMVRNQTVPVEYAVASGLSEHVSRVERERRVLEDLIVRDARFREQAGDVAALIMEAKRLALCEEAPAKISELIETRLAEAMDKIQACPEAVVGVA
ncbi:MAG TPA: exonuclease SbcCD subunit D [Blastocatellia bacterium]|nr:exonuclease SbcCD subunit D [Blastocatellia bacterium]HMV83258.1 exonuclease SbcCD subunit D [Blastocatellia bacterium]HMY71251.1 exonuclease SbcCD subunit D [Blastocatellia bacterium]HMZ16766.1 exonuclease SbcCD subunit D [Blastocatellia bacterium]HNG28268.1 exonuclease SbcCD subunit D [Blastocatellia bacterium]